MKPWVIAILLVVCWAAKPVHADEPSRIRYKLPVVKTNDTGQKCLNAAQWQKVIVVASEYKKHFDWRLKIEPVLMEYEALDATYGLIDDNLQLRIDLLEADKEGLKVQLSESETLRLKLQKGHRIEKGVMWVVILAETIVIGVLGIRGVSIR